MLVVLLAGWYIVSAFAALYMYIVTPARLPAEPVRRRVFLVTAIASTWAAVGIAGGYPLGWYAALVRGGVDVILSFLPDKYERERPRWARVVNICFGVLSLGITGLLFLPSVRFAFGIR